jgi:hypothetical protein
MKLRLIDKDGDTVDANGENEWRSFEDCTADLEAAFLSGEASTSYMPFKFVDYDSADRTDEMDVYSIINSASVDFKTTNLKVVPYKYRKS